MYNNFFYCRELWNKSLYIVAYDFLPVWKEKEYQCDDYILEITINQADRQKLQVYLDQQQCKGSIAEQLEKLFFCKTGIVEDFFLIDEFINVCQQIGIVPIFKCSEFYRNDRLTNALNVRLKH